ncbi:MAG: Glu-tRNA(Gln) amidotransferase subunit GatD [Thermoproteus sp. AZ2]|jgi:glutamyl-tRNA(Gln) amidotransferase subunit D|uniref:Glu-tRNA(Gln) amidotransferase subunit GatD n=1 Tax=Thermoproteus sp. AZ2 TaxID=1609232 RepID=A0ACC6UZT7_9CREN|nr:MAG: glutamyl-tRNA amidotransferase [Thermoproteus sp. AZ2]
MSRVRLYLEDGVVEGILMPPTAYSDPNVYVVKLRNGYNVGIAKSRVKKIEELEGLEGPPEVAVGEAREVDTGRPWVAIVATGGTILSRVEYSTGAVYPTMDPSLLFELAPGVSELASIRVEAFMAKFSEDMKPSDWAAMAEKAAEYLARGFRGVVFLHGTDTMHYSAAALAFAIRRSPGPVVFVGAQRSSDRPSSDAFQNIAGAVLAAAAAPFAESVLVMHKASSDGALYAHRGTRVRKMHTSRRDTFRSIGTSPLAEIDVEKRAVKMLREDYAPRSPGELSVKAAFSDRAALVKFYPGMPPSVISALVDMGVRGIVLEGTGFGHVAEDLLPEIKKAVDAGVVVAMTSQTIYGRTNLYIYRRGRELLALGVVPLEDMLPETAYVKMSWALANYKREEVPAVLRTPIAGEITPRSEPAEFGEL